MLWEDSDHGSWLALPVKKSIKELVAHKSFLFANPKRRLKRFQNYNFINIYISKHVEIKSTFTVKVSSSHIPDGLRIYTKSLEKHEFFSTSEPSWRELLAIESPSFSLACQYSIPNPSQSFCICYWHLGTAQELAASGLSTAQSSSVSN